MGYENNHFAVAQDGIANQKRTREHSGNDRELFLQGTRFESR
jgi:hypothetical protein